MEQSFRELGKLNEKALEGCGSCTHDPLCT